MCAKNRRHVELAGVRMAGQVLPGTGDLSRPLIASRVLGRSSSGRYGRLGPLSASASLTSALASLWAAWLALAVSAMGD
jgi:hypothetical protein